MRTIGNALGLSVRRNGARILVVRMAFSFRSNIDAAINSAYILMRLAVFDGEGDFYKTLDISTRCGQDSDCEPSLCGWYLRNDPWL